MKTWKCVGKFKRGNKIIGYKLMDGQGNIKEVRSNRLKDAIGAGEAMVLNLTLTSDGRLMPKEEKTLDIFTERFNKNTAENANKSSNIPNFCPNSPENIQKAEVISLEAMRERQYGNTLLKGLFEAFEDAGINFRITSCGFDVDKKETSAWFYLKDKNTAEEVDFSFRKLNTRDQIHIITPINEYIAEDLDSAKWQITEDLRELLDDPMREMRFVPHDNIQKFQDQVNISKEFRVDITRDHILSFVGQNIVYMGPKRTDQTTVEVPEFANVINVNAFDYCKNLKEIRCSIYHFRYIKDIISDVSSKVRVVKK